MILATLVIGALAAFISYIFIKTPKWRITATIISAVILISSLVFLTLNSHEHYGMHQVTTTKTVQVYPASAKNGLNMVLYKPVGTNGKETVVVYKKTLDQKKPSHTQANELTAANNRVKRVAGNTATLKVKETRWRFDSSAAKLWFGVSGLENKLVKRSNTFYLPKTWFYLSTDQVKAMQKKMAAMKSKAAQQKLKQQAQQYVMAQIKQAMMKNPALATDKAKQASLAKQYAQEFQQQMFKKVIKSLK
ncbi:DUF4811 domain-containing protein [Lactobacillus sp. ESL0680]|uniref:DUF4811 domain-containing protein n=1 Tax=Lactobacillus sp. ESL0680 TaxID=2983210 RepID=UPI0023F9DBBC|nr:DUF4811 domain-containing protein [Lactobacillus sp. ESL0680]WEV38863.1 DUF4811 domain-containing protein [Lactobacillus sp. ESL0680]